MNPVLLLLLDRLRELIGHPISINNGYATDGHATKSQHYLGNAVDFHVLSVSPREASRKIKDALEVLGLSDQVGLGCYPDWKNPGFHIDVRGSKARWSKVNGKYVKYEAGEMLL